MSIADVEKCHAHCRGSKGTKNCGQPRANGRQVCRLHGATAGRPISTPAGIIKALEREANRANSETHAAVQIAMQRDDLLDLNRYAALCSVLADRATDKLDTDLDSDTVNTVLAAIDQARKTAESITRIQVMQQELYSRKQSEMIDAVMIRIIAACQSNPELAQMLKSELTNFRAAAQLPEPRQDAIEGELIE